MSRSGYGDDCENLALWRGAVTRAIKGKRGQALLQDALVALDAMTVKALVSGTLVNYEGICLLGAVGEHREIDMSDMFDAEIDDVADVFNVAPALAAEIMFTNDEAGPPYETDSQRFDRMRHWVVSQINHRVASIISGRTTIR